MLDYRGQACKGDAVKLSVRAHDVLLGYKRVEGSEEGEIMCAVCCVPQTAMREWEEGLPSLLIVKEEGSNRTVQEKNRNPMGFEAKR